MALPFQFGNTGLYDIADFNVTTLIKDHNGFNVSESSTFVPLIPRTSSNFTVEHDITLNASKLASQKLSYLLFNDTNLIVDAILKLNFASVIPIELGTNISLPWGAPLYGLAVKNISAIMLNPNLFQATVLASYENHAFFDLNGTVDLQLLDNAGNQLGTNGTASLLPRGGQMQFQIDVPNPQRIASARLFFHTAYFSYGPYNISGLSVSR